MALDRRQFVTHLAAAAVASGCGAGSKALPTGADLDGGPDIGASDDSAASADTAVADTGGDSGLGDDTGLVEDTGEEAGFDWASTCEAGSVDLPETCTPTPPAGEGPYYIEDVPETAELDKRGTDSQPLVVDLRVLEVTEAGCVPVEGAVVDLWHADETGTYDMTDALHCRGRQVTDSAGTVCFSTFRPPNYGGEGGGALLAQHLHLNVLIDGRKVLTTQIYFADDPVAADPPQPPALVRPVRDVGDGWVKVGMNLVLGEPPPPPA